MRVKCIVTNPKARQPVQAGAFYEGIFGLKVVMDHGWSRTYSAGVEMTAQVNIASEGIRYAIARFIHGGG